MRPPDAAAASGPDAPPALLALPGVVGVGFGLKETGGRATATVAWRVYVREKSPRALLAPAERVPPTVGGVPTDVVVKAASAPTAAQAAAPPAAGARIANSRGVPGTLGCVAVARHDGSAVLLTNHHVLFGAGAAERDPVWLVEDREGILSFREVGRSLYGRLGTVRHLGAEHYVDCAVGTLAGLSPVPQRRLRLADLPPGDEEVPPAPGDRVRKTGWATGTTEGVVVDVAYPDVALVEGRAYPAPRQLLVRPAEGAAGPFSAEGDSGAVLRDEGGRAVGLLWGVNHRGESVACHIGPVLEVLGIEPAPPAGSSPLTCLACSLARAVSLLR